MMSALPLHGPVVQERRAAELSSCPPQGHALAPVTQLNDSHEKDTDDFGRPGGRFGLPLGTIPFPSEKKDAIAGLDQFC